MTLEFEYIHLIKKWVLPANLVKSIGDDCAVYAIDEENYQLYTTDCLIEKVHFSLDTITPFQLGFKSASVNLSDIAAMGGRPEFCLIALGLTKNVNQDWLKSFYDGFNEALKPYAAGIAGGDLSSSPHEIMVSVTAIGSIKKNKCIFRSGAKIGDGIFITGIPGVSALGFELLKKGIKDDSIIQKHLMPVARIDYGQSYARLGINSMIDLSDGLSGDLMHILEESQVGATLNKIPSDSRYEGIATQHKINWQNCQLHGGEDYELLFTASPQREKDLFSLAKEKGWPLYRIGEITKDVGRVSLVNSVGESKQLVVKSFDHFKKD